MTLEDGTRPSQTTTPDLATHGIVKRTLVAAAAEVIILGLMVAGHPRKLMVGKWGHLDRRCKMQRESVAFARRRTVEGADLYSLGMASVTKTSCFSFGRGLFGTGG